LVGWLVGRYVVCVRSVVGQLVGLVGVLGWLVSQSYGQSKVGGWLVVL
jgi:hypothetical protein